MMDSTDFPFSVLIVDDQPAIAQATETVLVEIGVDRVSTAGSVADALAQIDGSEFDLAVMDYDLGMETGWSVAERLCKDHIRIIVTTDQAEVTLPPACGDASVLSRPYDLNRLAALVARFA